MKDPKHLNSVLLKPYRDVLDKQVILEDSLRDISFSYRFNTDLAMNPWISINICKLALVKCPVIPQWYHQGNEKTLRIWGDREDLAVFSTKISLLRAYINSYALLDNSLPLNTRRKDAMENMFSLIQGDEKIAYYYNLINDTKISSRLREVYKFVLEFGNPLAKKNTDGNSYLDYTYIGAKFKSNKLIIFTRILSMAKN